MLILLIVLVVALVLLKDTIIKAVAERSIRSETGLEARIGKFEVGLFSPTVTIEDFTLYNSAKFGGAPFVVIPELHVEYDRTAIASRKLHLTLVRFNLAQVNIVQGKDGRLNYQELQAELEKTSSEKKSKPAADFTGIDTLNLSLGNVKYTSLMPGGQTWDRNLGIQHEILQNVRSASDLNALVLKVILRQGVDLTSDLKSPELLKETGRNTGKDVKKLFDGLAVPFKK